jgi:hypothetical protein
MRWTRCDPWIARSDPSYSSKESMKLQAMLSRSEHFQVHIRKRCWKHWSKSLFLRPEFVHPGYRLNWSIEDAGREDAGREDAGCDQALFSAHAGQGNGDRAIPATVQRRQSTQRATPVGCASCTSRRPGWFCSLGSAVLANLELVTGAISLPAEASLFTNGEQACCLSLICGGYLKLAAGARRTSK